MRELINNKYQMTLHIDNDSILETHGQTLRISKTMR